MSDWAHAPVHKLVEQGAYIVTTGIYRKVLHFSSPERRDFLLERLFKCAEEFGWALQAWAVMSNHYHFVALSPEEPVTLKRMLAKLHMNTARYINVLDQKPGRRVWYQYWDSRITYQRSYLTRLKYVHNNPVYHKVVQTASRYRWCSASWFEKSATPAFRKTLDSFKIDKVNVPDQF